MCRLKKEASSSRKFKVTIIETLRRTVEIEAGNHHEAEQIVSDGWHNSKYILGAEDFADVEFEATSVVVGHDKLSMEDC